MVFKKNDKKINLNIDKLIINKCYSIIIPCRKENLYYKFFR